MAKPPRSQSQVLADAAAERRVHAAALGYQPRRMKPVHFATSFLLTLTGRYRELELLNKAAVPKAAKPRARIVDEYVAENLLPRLHELGRVAPEIGLDAFQTLRSHLNAAFNNDGAALGPAFPPHGTFGSDYSAPSTDYVTAVASWVRRPLPRLPTSARRCSMIAMRSGTMIMIVSLARSPRTGSTRSRR
jgi:hypothetical protein